MYTKPGCVQCDATKRGLKNGLVKALGEDDGVKVFEDRVKILDMAVDPSYIDDAKALGYSAAPVCYIRGDHWYGFRPDKVKDVIETFQSELVSA